MHISSLARQCHRVHLFGAALYLLLSSTCFAQDRSTEAGEASIKDPALECQPYFYPPVSNVLASFPPIWQPASILPNDTAAMDLWNSIAGSVPSTTIPVKGTLNGEFGSSLSTYPANDPDCWWTATHCTTVKLPGLSPDVYQVPAHSLGYGFDDGPNCSHNAFYDYLQAQNQKATMFFIGSNVMNFPLEAQRAKVDGHEICVHSWSHRYMTAFSSQGAFAELYYSGSNFLIKAIQVVIGITPTCWRPPYGDVDDRIRAIANGLGLRTVMWDHDSSDSRLGISPSDLDASYQSFIDGAKAGNYNNMGPILLAHELSNLTMSKAVKFYPQLKASFQHILPVGAAVNLTFSYVPNNPSSPTPTNPLPGSVLVQSPSTSQMGPTALASPKANGTSTTSPGATSDATTLHATTMTLFSLCLSSMFIFH